MKYFIAFAVLLLSFPAFAQSMTPVSKDAANKYFASCISQPPSEQFSSNAQKMFCACTAARMTQYFTMEDMKTMTTDGMPGQRAAFNKMLVDIYAPCMETPTQEFHYNKCLTNTELSQYGDTQRICQCVGSSIGAHMKVNGQAIFRDLLTRNPNITDPMSAVVNDPQFEAFANQRLAACLK